jgi:hypothetical protein
MIQLTTCAGGIGSLTERVAPTLHSRGHHPHVHSAHHPHQHHPHYQGHHPHHLGHHPNHLGHRRAHHPHLRGEAHPHAQHWHHVQVRGRLHQLREHLHQLRGHFHQLPVHDALSRARGQPRLVGPISLILAVGICVLTAGTTEIGYHGGRFYIKKITDSGKDSLKVG